MKKQKMFRPLVLAVLVSGLGFMQVGIASAGSLHTASPAKRTACYKTSAEAGPGPRKAASACYKTGAEAGPGPR